MDVKKLNIYNIGRLQTSLNASVNTRKIAIYAWLAPNWTKV